MRRIVCLLFLVALLGGCVQADPTVSAGVNVQPAPEATPRVETAEENDTKTPAPSAPGQPQATPSQQTPTPRPSESGLPQATEILPSPTPRPDESSPPHATAPLPSPTPNGNEELPGGTDGTQEEAQTPAISSTVEPAIAERLYLDAQPGFDADIAYRFQGGSYTKEELSFLVRYLQIGEWRGLANVFRGLFTTVLSPDIRMSDFSEDGLFAAQPVIQGLEFIESDTIAYFSISSGYDKPDSFEYFFFFQKAGDAYEPLSAFRTPITGDDKPGREFLNLADELFLRHAVWEWSDMGPILHERLYSCHDGAMQLHFHGYAERYAYTSDSQLIEHYSITLSMQECMKTDFGFVIPVTAEIMQQYQKLQDSPTPLSLGTGMEFLLYYNKDENAMYVDADRQSFFADRGKLEEGQMKYVFGEQLQNVVTADRHPSEVTWAENLLAAEDWNALQDARPQQDDQLLLACEEFAPVMRLNANGRLFTEYTLRLLADTISQKAGGGLMDAIKQFYIAAAPMAAESDDADEADTESADEEQLPVFDIDWERVGDISVTLNLHSARERLAVLDIRYQERRESKGAFILFGLEGEAWSPQSIYTYSPYEDAGPTTYKYVNGALLATFQSDRSRRQPVYSSMLLGIDCKPLGFVSEYMEDGMLFTVKVTPPEGGNGPDALLEISATLDGETDSLMTCTMAMWHTAEGWLAGDLYANLVTGGRVQEHTQIAGFIEEGQARWDEWQAAMEEIAQALEQGAAAQDSEDEAP